MKLNFTGSGSEPSTAASIGRSFSVSCSCRLIVCVETTAFFFCATAKRIAGTRYASDLPTPVPASTARCSLILQRPRHRHGHLLLLRAELEIARLGKDAVGRKNLLHLRDQIGCAPAGCGSTMEIISFEAALLKARLSKEEFAAF